MAHPTQDQLSANGFGFSVCATESTDLAIDSEIHGQPECACEHDCRAFWYWWGTDLLSRTPSEGCDCDDKCVDPNLACEAISLLAPGCVVCGCGSPDDVPVSCDIVQDRTVYQALDADQQTVVPNVAGRTTLVISNLTNVTNDWSANLGNIGTDDGAGTFSWYVPPTSTIVLSSANSTYYVTYPGGAGPLYPPIDGTQNFTTLVLISRFPAITLMYGRTVVVEISEDGVTWTPIYSGPETPLAYGVTLTIPDGYSPVDSRTTYYYGEEDECSYQYALGTIPPFVPPPCGVLVYTITPNSICGTETWNVSINFTQIDGWGIGTVTPVINGTPGTAQSIILGTRTFGPFIMGDLVTFDFTSNLDTDCDFSTQTYFDPRVVEQDYNVLRAVDADEYAALNGDGNDYYIVSNLNGVTNPWSPYNGGAIWVGATSSLIPVFSLQVVYATDPGGALGFWQRPIGAPAAMFFPQPTFTYNTVTLVTVATLPPVAPHTQAWATLFMQALWTAPITGSPVTLYNGVPGGFTTASFTSATGSIVSGIAAYSDGCAVRVPALLDTFTPDGEVDPDYVGLGVNDVVQDIVSQPGGGVIIVGNFIHYDPAGAQTPANGITRLNSDGTLDTAYNDIVNNPLLPATGPGRRGFSKENGVDPLCAAIAYAAVKDSQGRIWVGGNFTHFNGVAASGVIRLLPSGARDPSFTNPGVTLPATPTYMGVTGLAVDNVDRVVATGWFLDCGGTYVGNVMRMLSANGALDTVFNGNTGTGLYPGFDFRTPKVRYDTTDDSFVFNSAQPPCLWWNFGGLNIRIVTPITGPASIPYTTGSITDRKTVVRLNGGNLPDCGKLKSIVAQGAQYEEVGHPISPNLLVQPDGTVMTTGTYSYYAATAVGYIAKLDGGGTIDPTFTTNSGIGFSGGTSAIDMLPNGQLLIGTDLPAATYTDVTAIVKSVLGLIRINADGTADTTWNIGTGFDNFVTTAKVDDFGNVWVGGGFSDFDGVTYNHIVKLL